MRTDEAAAQHPRVAETTSLLPNGGPPPSFEQLTLPLLGPLHNFARWMARDPHEAEDLVQETYLKALRTFASLRTDSNVRAWMFKILENTFLNLCTRVERRKTTRLSDDEDLAELAVSRETPELTLARHLERELLHGVMNQLPSHFRDVLLLCHVEEMSYQEIAENLSIPIGTVMSRLSRARKMMRGSLSSIFSQ